jgi:hypothetical protein
MPKITGARDRYGLPLTTRSTTAVEHYIAGTDRLLASEVGTEAALVQSLAADADFALAHAARAFIHQVQGNSGAAQLAADQALSSTAVLTRRERQHVETITHGPVGMGCGRGCLPVST